MKTKKHFKSDYLNEQFDLGNIVEHSNGFDVIASYEFKNIPIGKTKDQVRNKISQYLRNEGYKYVFNFYSKDRATEILFNLLTSK